MLLNINFTCLTKYQTRFVHAEEKIKPYVNPIHWPPQKCRRSECRNNFSLLFILGYSTTNIFRYNRILNADNILTMVNNILKITLTMVYYYNICFITIRSIWNCSYFYDAERESKSETQCLSTNFTTSRKPSNY